jgi:hypothetical protein
LLIFVGGTTSFVAIVICSKVGNEPHTIKIGSCICGF